MKRGFGAGVLAALCCLMMMGCSFAGREENALLVMYVPFGDGLHLMVDQQSGAVFTVHMPEQIVGIDGRAITPAQLCAGNILRIYGNGIMLESYPGQYPGVTRIEVVKTGDPQDAAQYQTLVDAIYTPPDPAQPPCLQVEYKTAQAVCAVLATPGGYQWRWEDAQGQEQSAIACAPHILCWPSLCRVRLSEPADVALRFDRTPSQVTAYRWPVSSLGSPDACAGEAVAAELEDGAFSLPVVEPGYVYQICAVWEQGSAEFGFAVYP